MPLPPPTQSSTPYLARFALSIRALWRIGILIEAERAEIAHHPARLGEAIGQNLFDVARERVGLALIVGLGVAQEGGEVADGGETEPCHLRILRGVDELVELARLEFGAFRQEADRLAGRVIAPSIRRQGRRLVVPPRPPQKTRP